MRTTCPTLRLVAVVMLVVVLVTVSTPAEAHADVLTTIGIATLIVAGVIIIAYLVIANVADQRRGDEGQVIWVATAVPVDGAGGP